MSLKASYNDHIRMSMSNTMEVDGVFFKTMTTLLLNAYYHFEVEFRKLLKSHKPEFTFSSVVMNVVREK